VERTRRRRARPARAPGGKSKLARILGLPRQRLQEFLRERRALPDAERTLLMLVWLQARREGRDLA
jgi:hypothetical protein